MSFAKLNPFGPAMTIGAVRTDCTAGESTDEIFCERTGGRLRQYLVTALVDIPRPKQHRLGFVLAQHQSTDRQYNLVNKARSLGRSQEQIRVRRAGAGYHERLSGRPKGQ
jgi:hypothetical protein